MFDLLVLGGLGVDIRVRVPAIPMPAADSVIVPPIDLRIGNTGAGVALAAHAVGLSVMVVDILGEDPAGDIVRGALARAANSSGTRLAVSLRNDPRGTRRSVNLVDQEGRRMSLYDPRGPEAPHAFDADEIAALVADARHVHVSIMDWMRELMPAARQAARVGGTMVSTDLHDWDGTDAYHQAFAAAADWVFLSDVRLGGSEGRARVDAALSGRTRVITSGARGSEVVEADDVATPVPAASPPGRVVDTNGAGDAFVAGFVAARLRGHPAVESASYGAQVAAAACTWDGMEYPPGLLPVLT